LRLVVDYMEGTLSVATWDDSAWIGGTASSKEYINLWWYILVTIFYYQLTQKVVTYCVGVNLIKAQQETVHGREKSLETKKRRHTQDLDIALNE